MKRAPLSEAWQGRIDPEDGELGMRIHQKVQPWSTDHSGGGVTLIGLASDLGVDRNQGRVGARDGPDALRGSLANMAWHFAGRLFDAGDVQLDDSLAGDALAHAQSEYGTTVGNALTQNQFVIGMGGGHEIAWGSYQGCRQHLDRLDRGERTLGILNFDAHFDLRRPPAAADWAGSSGTPFFQVAQDCRRRALPFHYTCLGISAGANTAALFEFAKRHEVGYLLDTQCDVVAAVPLIKELISAVDALYVSICLDALPPNIAPGVSAPSTLGVSMAVIVDLLKVAQNTCDELNIPWLMADIAELNPAYDQDQRTARIAARLAYELIGLNQSARSVA